MTAKILVTIMALGLLAACSKNKYATKPQLTYKGVSSKLLSQGQQLRFTFEVTDAEGDIQDSMWVQEIVKKCPTKGFISKYPMPDFTGTKNLKGEIDVCYTYGVNSNDNTCPSLFHSNCNIFNDSVTFRFVIKDKAQNTSDTISSDEIVLIK